MFQWDSKHSKSQYPSDKLRVTKRFPSTLALQPAIVSNGYILLNTGTHTGLCNVSVYCEQGQPHYFHPMQQIIYMTYCYSPYSLHVNILFCIFRYSQFSPSLLLLLGQWFRLKSTRKAKVKGTSEH